jgi:hypothetical protein
MGEFPDRLDTIDKRTTTIVVYDDYDRIGLLQVMRPQLTLPQSEGI